MDSDETRLEAQREKEVWVENWGNLGLSLVWLLRKYYQVFLETKTPIPHFIQRQFSQSGENDTLLDHVTSNLPHFYFFLVSKLYQHISGREEEPN